MVLCFSNSLLSAILKDINLLFLFLSPPLSLNVLTNLLILGNIKTSSKYSIKYLELFFVSASFEMTILSTLNYQYYQNHYQLSIINIHKNITNINNFY